MLRLEAAWGGGPPGLARRKGRRTMGARRFPARYWLWMPLALLMLGALVGAGLAPRPVKAVGHPLPTRLALATPHAVYDPYGRVAPDLDRQFGVDEIATYIVVLSTQADTHNTLS